MYMYICTYDALNVKVIEVLVVGGDCLRTHVGRMQRERA